MGFILVDFRIGFRSYMNTTGGSIARPYNIYPGMDVDLDYGNHSPFPPNQQTHIY